MNNKKYPPEELVLFKHFKLTLEVFFQSFTKASIQNIQKSAKLFASLVNFSLNAWQKKLSKKKNMHASELKFIEEVYVKNKTSFDEIVAVNIFVFLVRCGVCKIEKDAKVSYNKDLVDKICVSDAFTHSDQSWTRLGNTSVELGQFIGAYSLITEIKKDVSKVPKLIERSLTTQENKLSFGENAHLKTEKTASVTIAV